MTAKKRLIEDKKMNLRTKRFTAGAASALLGAGILIGGGNRPVKASITKEDVTIELENKTNNSQTETHQSKQGLTASEQTNVNEDTVLTAPEQTNVNEDAVLTAPEQTNVNEDTVLTAPEQVNDSNNSVVETSEQDESAKVQLPVDDSKNTVEVDTTVKENATEEITTSTEQSATSTLKESNDSENTVENTVIQPNGTTSQEVKNSYQDSLEKVEDINAAANATIKEAIDKFTHDIDKLGGTVTVKPGNQVVINTTVNGIEVSKAELEKHIKDQIANLDKSLNEYKTKLEAYNKELEDYKTQLQKYEEAKEAYIQKLKDMGLWNDQNVDLDDIKQDLVLSKDEVNTKVEADVLNGNVTIKPDTLLYSNLPFLNNLANINNNQTITGDFLKLTYTGFEKSYYGNDLIGKIEITFSDWDPAKTSHKYAGIYYGDKITDGFFYTKGEGVTMEMKIYDKNGKQITIKPNSAYITVGSLNSKGEGNDYVEKAEIINGVDHKGEGVAIPGSSIGVHKGEGQYGGDILYSKLNNEILNYLNSGGNEADAIKIWGKDIVEEFKNWDSTTDRSKEIFGCGLFSVSGNSIKIRFSNKLGSAWATYSTTVPRLAFDGTHPGEAPEKPKLEVSYSPGNIVLNKNSSVHIHYVDVSGVKDTTNYEPGMGVELEDQLQSIIDLAVGDSYNNILWNWEDKGYILAISPTDIHPGATSGTITDDEKHYYIYLTHKITTSTEDTSRDKVVNQTIHYVYEDGGTAAPDYVSLQLVFTQSGKKITTVNAVTGETVVTYDWNGEWTQTQSFVTVKSPTIQGFHTDRLEVGPYDITVTNDNYGENLDKEDTVVYKANPVIPDPEDPKPDTPDPEDPAPKPSDPTPDMEEESTPPLPEEETGPEYPAQPEEDEETIAPHASEKPKSAVASLKAASVNNETPTTVSTETTEVAKQVTNEGSLPETGEHDKNKMSAFFGALASVLGITGLAGAKKRKKKDE